jgi:hypothetical protein
VRAARWWVWHAPDSPASPFTERARSHAAADRRAKQLVDAAGGAAAVNRPDGRTVAVYTSTPKGAGR